jgi:hypothetical protein
MDHDQTLDQDCHTILPCGKNQPQDLSNHKNLEDKRHQHLLLPILQPYRKGINSEYATYRKHTIMRTKNLNYGHKFVYIKLIWVIKKYVSEGWKA